MASKKICDYCLEEIKGPDDNFTVDVFDDDSAVLERDCCRSCVDIVKRLLRKPLPRLKKALEAASDR